MQDNKLINLLKESKTFTLYEKPDNILIPPTTIIIGGKYYLCYDGGHR